MCALYKTKTGHPADIKQALGLVQQFLNGIHALHEQGIAHCDIKAENIMIEMTKDGPKLTLIDLGAATKFGEKSNMISSNAAPEAMRAFHAGNRIATPQEDIYAAGAVLCELLFGECPCKINGQSASLWRKILYKQTDQPQIHNQNTQPATELRYALKFANQLNDQTLYPPAIFNVISDLIVKMCAIDPNDRPSSQYCLAVLNDLVLCDHDAIRNDTTRMIKPMITGTLPQAMQLIHDLNNLNQKESLTKEEKATKEVLIYNLKRDFEISPNNQQLKTQLQEIITRASNGEVLQQDTLDTLNNKCQNDIQRQILQGLQNKLTAVNTDKANQLKEKISKQLGKAQEGNLISQDDINNLRTAVTIEIQKDTLQNLKTQLKDINTVQANELKEKISKQLETAEKGNLISQNDINNLRTAVTIEIQKDTLQNLKTKLKGKHHFFHNIKNIFLYPFKALFSWNHQVYFYTDWKINQYLKHLQDGQLLDGTELSWIEKKVNDYRSDSVNN